MLLRSPLLFLWVALIQVLISGSQAEDEEFCKSITTAKCTEDIINTRCPEKCNNPTSSKLGYVAAAVGTGVAAVALAPAAVAAAGFGATGIAAGSLASSLMSTAAVAGGTGGVAPMVAGGVVAALQSAGAAGLASTTLAAVGATGAAVGVGVVKATEVATNVDRQKYE